MNYLKRLKNLERPLGTGAKRARSPFTPPSGPFGTSQTGAFEKNNADVPQSGTPEPGCITDEWSPLGWREFYAERAAIIEHDAGEPRQVAEARAWECCAIRWLDHNPMRSDPGSCAACHRAEDAQHCVIPYGLGPHAWLHPSCWQAWHRERREHARAALVSFGIEAPQ